jgi:hypothetical protein
LIRQSPHSELRIALWPEADGSAEAGAKSLRNYVSELRRALGAEFIPSARGSGHAVSAAVQTDWDQLKLAVVKAKAEGADEVELLREALSLVRGRPFAGVDWDWAFAESLVSEMEVTIGRVAQRLAALSMETEDLDRWIRRPSRAAGQSLRRDSVGNRPPSGRRSRVRRMASDLARCSGHPG